jgi:hypothetical protein
MTCIGCKKILAGIIFCLGLTLAYNARAAITLSDGKPSGTLLAGTTETMITFSISPEAFACKYSTTPGVAYEDMPTATYTRSSVATKSGILVSDLTNGTTYHYYVRCYSNTEGVSTEDYEITFSVANDAPPTISSVSGTVSDNETVTVTGSGFGTTSPMDVSSLNFEDGTVGNNISENNWEASSASETTYTPKYTNVKALNGGKSMLCSYPSGIYDCVLSRDFQGPVGKAYLSFWVYGDYKAFSPETNAFQWKMFRFTPTGNLTGTSPIFGLSQWPASDGTCSQAYHSTGYPIDDTNEIGGNDAVPNGNMWRDCFPRSQWYRMEIFAEESDINTPNGTEVIKYYDPVKNSWTLWSAYWNDIITRARSQDNWEWLHLSMYIGNSSVGKDVDAYWDNVYLQRGTFARFELCDSSTWSSCKNREVQKPLSWSNGSVQLSINTGTFTNGQQAYLIALDDNNNPSAGYPVTISGSSTGDTTPPNPPTGVEVM